MNSRDAAYDEEELIRRAIEESKADTKSNPDETETHLGKRSRSDSVTCVSPDQIISLGVRSLTVCLGTETGVNAHELPRHHLALSRSAAIPRLIHHLMTSPNRSPRSMGTGFEDREPHLGASSINSRPKRPKRLSLKLLRW